MAEELRAAGVRVTVDDSSNSLGKKIRNAEVDKVRKRAPIQGGYAAYLWCG